MDLLVTQGNCSAEIPLHYRLGNWWLSNSPNSAGQRVVIFLSLIPASPLWHCVSIPHAGYQHVRLCWTCTAHPEGEDHSYSQWETCYLQWSGTSVCLQVQRHITYWPQVAAGKVESICNCTRHLVLSHLFIARPVKCSFYWWVLEKKEEIQMKGSSQLALRLIPVQELCRIITSKTLSQKAPYSTSVVF